MAGLLAAMLARHETAWADPQYQVNRVIAVGGDGGWDYLTLDASGQRLFITRATRVQVLETASGKVIGEIPDTAGVHGVALAPDVGRGFTSNGRSNTVTVCDLKTLKVLGQVNVGKKPDAILYDKASHRVFTMNGESGDATAIKADDGTVLGTVPLEGKPEFAAADGQGHVFVNLEDKSRVAEFDSRTLKLLGSWSIAPGEEPSGLGIDPKSQRLFIGCHNRLMVIFDIRQHKAIATVPIGEGVDADAYDRIGGLAFSSNGDGTLTVVGTNPIRVQQVVRTRPGARTMAVDPIHHCVYLCTAKLLKKPDAAERAHGVRPTYVPDSFVVVVVGRK